MFNLFDFSATPGTDEANDPFGTAVKPLVKPSVPSSVPVPFVSQKAFDDRNIQTGAKTESGSFGSEDVRKFKDLVSKGVEPGRAKSLILKSKQTPAAAQPKPEVDKGFFDSVGDSLSKRASTIADVNSTMSRPTQVAALAGEGVGFIADIGGAALSALTPTAISDFVKDKAKDSWDSLSEGTQARVVGAIKGWQEGWDGFSTAFPETARNLTSALQVGSAIPTGKTIKVGADALWNTAEAIGTWVGKQATKAKTLIKDTAIDTYDRVISGLTPKEKKGLQNNPFQREYSEDLFKRIEGDSYDDIKNVQTEHYSTISDNIKKRIGEVEAELGEGSKVYASIREARASVSSDDILASMRNTLRNSDIDIVDGKAVATAGSKNVEITAGDLASYTKMYNSIAEQALRDGWRIDAGQAIDFRKAASALARLDEGTSTKGRDLMHSLRTDIDVIAKRDVPLLREVDENFVDKLQAFKDATVGLVYKQGDVKDEFRSNFESIISNLNKPNRKELKDRLEEFIPWVTKRVEAVQNLRQIDSSISSKEFSKGFTSPMWGMAAGALMGSAFWIFGTFAGAVLGLFGGAVGETKALALKIGRLKKILSITSPAGKKEMEAISKSIDAGDALSPAYKKRVADTIKQIEDMGEYTAKEKAEANKMKLLPPASGKPTDKGTINIKPVAIPPGWANKSEITGRSIIRQPGTTRVIKKP